MAYTSNLLISNTSTVSTMPSVVSNGSVSVLSNRAKNSTFYQLEIAEVIDIIKDSSHVDYHSPADIGKIKYRLYESEANRSEGSLSYAYPTTSQVRSYPVKHELVIISKFLEKPFYTTLNFLNYINNSSLPNISNTLNYDTSQKKVSNYKDVEVSKIPNSAKTTNKMGDTFQNLNQSISTIPIKEGDFILNGRFGNTMNFTSNEKDGTPSIKINLKDASLFSVESEDLTKDTGIWIVTNETLNFKKNSPEIDKKNNPPSSFQGKQIYIGSDRIILNSINQELIGISGKGISFSTNNIYSVDSSDTIRLKSKNKTILESNKVYLASENADQQVILGNKLVNLLKDLLTAIESLTVTTGTGPSGPPINIADFKKIGSNLKSILSEQCWVK